MSKAPRRRRELGFSIVELMVASTISVIMFTVIIQLFSNNKEAYRIQEGASVLNENARYAVSHLQYYLRLADHWGGIEPDEVNIDAGSRLLQHVAIRNRTKPTGTIQICGDDTINVEGGFSTLTFPAKGYDSDRRPFTDEIGNLELKLRIGRRRH